MLITEKHLRKLVRDAILLNEAHEPGELVQLGNMSVMILGRWDVGRAPLYIAYIPKG